MRSFEHSGFSPAYECVVDPEFPGSGQWNLPVVAYSREGARVDEFRSRWGAPMIVEVQPDAGSGWVGFFEAGGLGGVDAVSATPDPFMLSVVAEGRCYVVNVHDPSTCWLPRLDPVIQVTPAPSAGTLLLAGFTNLVGIGSCGMRWESQRLCLDGLKVLCVEGDHVYCEGDYLEGTESFVIDARTGEYVSGRAFVDPFG